MSYSNNIFFQKKIFSEHKIYSMLFSILIICGSFCWLMLWLFFRCKIYILFYSWNNLMWKVSFFENCFFELEFGYCLESKNRLGICYAISKRTTCLLLRNEAKMSFITTVRGESIQFFKSYENASKLSVILVHEGGKPPSERKSTPQTAFSL